LYLYLCDKYPIYEISLKKKKTR